MYRSSFSRNLTALFGKSYKKTLLLPWPRWSWIYLPRAGDAVRGGYPDNYGIPDFPHYSAYLDVVEAI